MKQIFLDGNLKLRIPKQITETGAHSVVAYLQVRAPAPAPHSHPEDTTVVRFLCIWC